MKFTKYLIILALCIILTLSTLAVFTNIAIAGDSISPNEFLEDKDEN